MTFASLLLLIFIGYGIYCGYRWLDSLGWVSHREETVITARSDWLVGESKDCWSAPVNYWAAQVAKYGGVTLDKSGSLIDDSMSAYVMSSVSCDDGPQHKMKVTFWGRKMQTDYRTVTWHCTKEQVLFSGNTFTCYQTGGHR